MNTYELRRYDMMVLVNQFGTKHAADFPAGTLGNELFEKLSTILSQLSVHAGAVNSRRSDQKQSVSRKSDLRDQLEEELKIIGQTARSIETEVPNLDRKFRMTFGLSARALVGLARSFASDAVPYEPEFIRHAMPADFLARLNRLIDDFESSIVARGEAAAVSAETNAIIDTLIADGMATLKRLDVVVQNTYRSQPATLSGWERARHLPKASAAAASTAPTETKPATA